MGQESDSALPISCVQALAPVQVVGTLEELFRFIAASTATLEIAIDDTPFVVRPCHLVSGPFAHVW